MKRILAIALVAVTVIVAYSFLSGPLGESKATIKVSGAWALYPMMVRWSEEYQTANRRVKIEVSAGGAGKGMTDALAGLVDIGMVSRSIYPEEVAKGAYYVAVVEDAVVATMNRDNSVLDLVLARGITKQVFYNIFVEGNVTTWGQVVGKPEVTDEIHVYVRSDACGAAETWANYWGKKQEDLRGIGVYGDPGLVEAVRKDPLGIGFNNIGYAYDMKTKSQVDGIAVVPIDINSNGVVDREENFYSDKTEILTAIGQRIYPHPPARQLYLVTKGKFTGATKEFVEWILTEGQKYVEEVGYVPLPNEVISQQLEKLK